MANENTFLSTEEVSKLLNVHSNTVMRWIKSGKLPSTKIGREYRIPRDAIENRMSKVAHGTRVIAVANQKGGVAKTTSTLNIAAALALSHKRVLIIDLDPQGGSGVSIGIATDTLNKTVYNVLVDDDMGFTDIIMKTKFGFDLAPSNIDLAGAEIELKQLLASEQVLKRKLEEIVDDYDFILLDCPPSLGMLTINALTASKEVLIPMAMEHLALRGLDMLAKTIGKIRSITNPDLQYLGMLGTKYDRTTLNSKEIFEALSSAAQNSGIKLFNTYIPDTVRFKESPRYKTPLVIEQPNHEGSKAYITVAEEIING
ncbi:MAG: AAA family ATPase [Candidatus Levyibacteriota bacterium]